MIPAPPIFDAALVRRPALQRKDVEDGNIVNERVSYLLSGIKKPPDHSIIVCLHDSEPVVQDGPMCGLVAISMASKLIHGRILEQASPRELLSKARQLQYTKQGEFFSAENLLRLSLEQLECSGVLLSFQNIDTIIPLILKGSAVIFPYDCDKNHMPCKLKGHKAHWALTVGCSFLVSNQQIDNFLPFCDNKVDYYSLDTTKLTSQAIGSIMQLLTLNNIWLFCRHGKSRHVGMWPLVDIMESNANLLELQPRFNLDNCVMPAGGMQDGLCGKAVLLEKNEQFKLK